MENFIYISSVLLVIGFIFWIGTRKSKEERRYEEYLEKSMEDEFIYDPETGARITLEQAESGHYINPDNEFATIPKKEIDNIFSEEEKEAQHALNYIRSSKYYLQTTISDELLETLESSRMLSKYEEWHYSHPYSFEGFNTIFLLPAVAFYAKARGEEDYSESQIMYCTRFNVELGHYYLREKKTSEKLFDLIKNDDELTLTNYESFTYKNSINKHKIIQILKHFEGSKGLEIEFINQYLLIKNLKLINLNDVMKIEHIVRNILL